jgi:acetoacetyl-CoA synthetase
MPDSNIPNLLWQPTPQTQKHSHLQRYIDWLRTSRGLAFETYDALWQWSCRDLAAFWESQWAFFQIISHSPYRAVLEGNNMPDCAWFPGATLNYAEHVFRQKNDRYPAIIFKQEDRPTVETSWAALEQQTAAFAQFLRSAGVNPGDRVAAYLPNSPHAMVAVLATMSIGAVWSSCSPDFGAASVADRFAQIAPKILIAVDGYSYGGKRFDKRDTLHTLCGLLPTVEKIVFIPYLDETAVFEYSDKTVVVWAELLVQYATNTLSFLPLPFSHPIWVLYSSGTTGVPKAITHSHGGNLLEHLKYLHFHNDIHPGERFFWYSTTGWMMWNFTLGALLTGSTIVLYDGSPGYPDLQVLWELAETTQITHFGTSAPFLVGCLKAGLVPKSTCDLSVLRSIGSTGSPLPPEAYRWVYDNVKADLWLSSMAGGTDVCTAWVGGNPLLPVYQGEIQCRCLGCAMESWNEDGQPVPVNEVGEMVVTKPMPSMPIFFWDDPNGARYKSSYFEHFPGVWRHGDWIRITERGTVVIHGRSDATLNRQGVRIGTAEIYRALDLIPAVKDALIVNLEHEDGTDWMPLFVVLNSGISLTDDIVSGIKTTLRKTYSPRHVPDIILEVPDIPYTISGKKMETPVKNILQGKAIGKAFNSDSMRNPESMAYFIALAKTR